MNDSKTLDIHSRLRTYHIMEISISLLIEIFNNALINEDNVLSLNTNANRFYRVIVKFLGRPLGRHKQLPTNLFRTTLWQSKQAMQLITIVGFQRLPQTLTNFVCLSVRKHNFLLV